MPRCARIKADDRKTYYHLTNRIAGSAGEFPFGDREKERMGWLIKRLSRFFTVEVLGFQVMGNHFHIVCHAPAELLTPEAAVRRYNRFYGGSRPTLAADDPRCLKVARQMRDISCLTGWLQQQFSAWYNRTREVRRRGPLWAGRFKSVILERDTALWNCLCYVEMNPVRAGLAGDPAEYRFGSWGEWGATGRHPFGENLRKHLVAYEGERACAQTLAEIQRRFRVEFARLHAAESGARPDQVEAAMRQAERAPAFELRLDRRVRYWSDGLVIGSEAFVRETAARFWTPDRIRRQRLAAVQGPAGTQLCACRRLHALPA